MKTRTLLRRSTAGAGLLISSLVLAGAPIANACTVCMGAEPKTGEAINGAIFFMLGCIGFVLASIVGVAWTIWRRSRSVPPHVAFAHSVPDPS